MKAEQIISSDPALNYLRDSMLKRYEQHEREPECCIELAIDAALPKDGFQICRTDSRIKVSAADMSSLFCGAGTVLHGDVRDNGFHAMQKPFRAVYFATHFDNWYCTASREELLDYVTDLALWGFNTIVFWHDMHHFKSWDDPAAEKHRNLLLYLAECGRKCGLKVCSLHLANEGGTDTPNELRAQKAPGIYSRGGWYESQICPSRPEGMKALCAHFTMVINDFLKRLHPDYVILWPYDQGGCQCPDCMPWGGNGFVKASAAFADMLKKHLPDCRIILSTWFMDAEELTLLTKAVHSGVLRCDYLTIEQEHRACEEPLPEPDDIPVIGFPDISMRMNPWGGYGADPQPMTLQAEWDACKTKRAGGYLYSEGIFDDVSKVIFSQFYCWDRPAMETAKLYGAYECGSEFAGSFANMVRMMEINSFAARQVPAETMKAVHDKLFAEYPSPSISRVIHTLVENGLDGCWQYVMAKKDNDFKFHGSEIAHRECNYIEWFLPKSVKYSPRWRMLRARAVLDAAMGEHDGKLCPRCEPWLKELSKCYHVSPNTIDVLTPPASNRPEKLHTKQSLTEDLERLGIPHDGILLVHSAYKLIGKVEGGPGTILDALIEYLIPHGGTLLFPTFTYLLKPEETFSVNETGCLTGVLPELFRKRPGVIRSLHPSHSVAGLGREAAELLADSELSRTPFDPHTPWPKLKDRHARILFLGTGLACNTFLHYVDEVNAPFETLYRTQPDDRSVIDRDGKRIRMIQYPMCAAHSDYFAKMRVVFEKHDAIRNGKFGDAEADLVDAFKAAETVGPLIRKYPRIFMEDETNYLL